MATRTRFETTTLGVGAGVLIALLVLRAFVRVDDAWDSLAYHLPFAARLWDIVPRASFEMDGHLEVLFRAYPVGVEWLQGALWKLTGRVQAASFVGLGSLVAFVELLRRRFDVSRYKSVFALLAIPMVQIHATSAYVDLPGNVAAAAGVLLAHRAFSVEQPEPRDAGLAMVCAAFAASSKFQMAPVALLVALAVTLLLLVRKAARSPTVIAVYALALVVGAYPYLRNTVVFGSPFFPISTPSLWRGDGGTLIEYIGPDYLGSWPGPARWLVSVLGVGELDPGRGMFSVDAASGDDGGPTYLMGGYFGPWVVVQLVFLWRLNRSGSRAARTTAITMLLVTLLTAASPHAYQLRYYMYWMLVAVALNLSRATTLAESAPFGSHLYTRLSLGAFAVVVFLTQGRFLDPGADESSIARLVRDRVPAAVLGRLRPGGRYCLIGQPFPPILLSAESLGRAPYSLKSSVLAEGCDDRTPIWMTVDGERPR